MKISTTLAAVALAATVLAGCGGGDSAYCTDLEEAQKSFDGMNSGDIAAIEDSFATLHDLADAAPEEVSDDWKVLDGALTDAEGALEETGVSLTELAQMQETQEIPEGLDAAKLQEVVGAFQNLATTESQEATDAIEKHAKDECGVDMSSTGS